MIRFLSCDWGTSSFRLRLVNVADMSVLVSYSNQEGINKTFSLWKAHLDRERTNREEFYFARIQEGIDQLEEQSGEDLSELLVICSGMASSSVGIKELPYSRLPFDVSGHGLEMYLYPVSDKRRQTLLLLSGLRSDHNVMRGEETQLIGIISQFQDFDGSGLFIFPGTHSKHILVQKNKISEFNTYMTGEIFSLLSKHSILANSIAEGYFITDQRGKSAFTEGVLEGARHPVLSKLFHVRTNELFKYLKKEENYHYLSGLLIGDELRILADNHKHVAIYLCPEGNLSRQYSLACEILGIDCRLVMPEVVESAVIHGQFKIFNQNLNHERSIFLGSF